MKLEQSLKYASVAISMVGQCVLSFPSLFLALLTLSLTLRRRNGKPQVFGYVPVVVAKCGLYLKETAQNTEGIFRVSGSNRRINELQAIFDLPPRYGKDLDWAGYSPHDAASVLRRFLNSMPEPVIPQDLYRNFTAVLREWRSIRSSSRNEEAGIDDLLFQNHLNRSTIPSPPTANSSPSSRRRPATSSSISSTSSPSSPAPPTRIS